MGSVVDIPLDRLRSGPNDRKVFVNIPELAGTIREVGLLRNLVVVPDPESAADDVERYIIRGGERRFRALQLLVSEGAIEKDHLVPCLILRTEGEVESLADNEGHELVPAWNMGAGYLRLMDAGMTQEQIGKAVGKSQTYISLCVRVHRGLSPKVVKVLERLGSACPNILDLGRLASIVDRDTLKPDDEKQLLWLQNHLCRPNKKRKGATGRLAVGKHFIARIKSLQEMHIPLEHVQVVEAVIRYVTSVDDVLILPGQGVRKVSKDSFGKMPDEVDGGDEGDEGGDGSDDRGDAGAAPYYPQREGGGAVLNDAALRAQAMADETNREPELKPS